MPPNGSLRITIHSPHGGSADNLHHTNRKKFLGWGVHDHTYVKNDLMVASHVNKSQGKGHFSTWILDNHEQAIAFIEKFPGSQIISIEGTDPIESWLTVLGIPSCN